MHKTQRNRVELKKIYVTYNPSIATTRTTDGTIGLYAKGDTIYLALEQDTSTRGTIKKITSIDGVNSCDTYTVVADYAIAYTNNQVGVHLETTGAYKDTEILKAIFVYGNISDRKLAADTYANNNRLSDAYLSLRWLKMRTEIEK